MIFITWLILSLVVGLIGIGRQAGFWGGFFISIVLSPLLGLIIVLAMGYPKVAVVNNGTEDLKKRIAELEKAAK